MLVCVGWAFVVGMAVGWLCGAPLVAVAEPVVCWSVVLEALSWPPNGPMPFGEADTIPVWGGERKQLPTSQSCSAG